MRERSERIPGTPHYVGTEGRMAAGDTELAHVLPRLAKGRIFAFCLGPALALSLALGEGFSRPRSILLAALFSVVVAAGSAAALILGTPNAARSRRFGYTCVALSFVALAVCCLVSGYRPWWVAATGCVVIALGVRYSSGIDLRHRFSGGGQLVAAGALAFSVALPYAAMAEQMTARAVVESALFGLWLLQVLVCSSSADADDERAVGRGFIVTLFVLNWTIAIGSIGAGVLSPWAAALLQPLWTVEAYMFYKVMRGTWRPRLDYGFVAVSIGVLGLAIDNLLA